MVFRCSKNNGGGVGGRKCPKLLLEIEIYLMRLERLCCLLRCGWSNSRLWKIVINHLRDHPALSSEQYQGQTDERRILEQQP